MKTLRRIWVEGNEFDRDIVLVFVVASVVVLATLTVWALGQ